MKSHATAKYIRQSPYKVRRVLDLVRGLPVTEAREPMKPRGGETAAGEKTPPGGGAEMARADPQAATEEEKAAATGGTLPFFFFVFSCTLP